ncbi:FAD-binding domain-containing protein [Bernardetia sp. ABR2-2B]|uniref:cryptochrome/deoxyribodipyrimidine photo-lyase family protein n=1 Tax=Bernardetia sp. ABR2-2B TaxID=3127472 RepID=UPI0030D5C570
MEESVNLSIYWLKKDFRLADNPALVRALEDAKKENSKVALVFVIENEFLEAPETSAFHVNSVFTALSDLQNIIKKEYNKEIAIFTGNVIDVFEKIHKKTPFQKLYSHLEIGINWTFERDKNIIDFCRKNNIEWIELLQTGVFRRLKSRDERRKLWNKFNYTKALPIPTKEDFEIITLPTNWKCYKEYLKKELKLENFSFTLKNENGTKKEIQSVSETAAHQTLEDFLYYRGIAYRGGISSPNTAFTAGSRFSAHLAWGTLSGRFAYQATQERQKELKAEIEALENQLKEGKKILSKKQKENIEILIKEKKRWKGSLSSFLSRLHWRDHFIQRLETEPQTEFEAINPAYNALKYDDKTEFLEAWKTGCTGYPLVDACMRCLNQTGFINFRMRAMIASFAMHTLHLSWKTINAPMARLYTDYEAGIHLSQLQMQAGVVGINTLRVYSPTKQLIDHDPECDFVKEWIPELQNYTPKEIISHAENLDETVIEDYPKLIVDWEVESKRMKDKYFAIKKLPETKEISKKVYEKHGSRMGSMTSRASRKRNKTNSKKTTANKKRIEKIKNQMLIPYK